MIPISSEVLFSLYGGYNLGTWPAPFVGYALGVLALGLALRPLAASSQLIGLILAAFWLWTGSIFHITTFAPLNWGAWIFGVLFMLEGLLLWLGAFKGGLHFRFMPGLRGGFGLALFVFALAYPLLDLASGHPWPQMQLPGTLPAPTTLATLGLLLMGEGRGARTLSVLPLAWALTEGAAAVFLGIWQDVAMAAGVVAGTALLFAKPATQR